MNPLCSLVLSSCGACVVLERSLFCNDWESGILAHAGFLDKACCPWQEMTVWAQRAARQSIAGTRQDESSHRWQNQMDMRSISSRESK
jgi:hypothetical protein